MRRKYVKMRSYDIFAIYYMSNCTLYYNTSYRGKVQIIYIR